MQRNIFNALMVVMGIFIFGTVSQVAYADTCPVTKIGNNELRDDGISPVDPIQGSLANALYEHAQEGGVCRDGATIENSVYVTETLTIDNDANTSFAMIGDSTDEGDYHVFKSFITDGSPLFNVSGSDNVTIQYMAVKNYAEDANNKSSPLLKCSNSKSLTLDHVLIQNNPTKALIFDGCGNLTISNLTIDASSNTAYIPTDENNDGSNADEIASAYTTPYISITRSTNVTIENLKILNSTRAIDRDAILIDGGSNIKINGITVVGTSGENTTVLTVKNTTLDQLTVNFSELAGSAIKLTNIDNPSIKNYTLEQVSGVYEGAATVAGTAADYASAAGDGIVVNGTSHNMSFTLGADITGFKRSGFVVEGEAEQIFIAGSNHQIANNGGFGVVVSDAIGVGEVSVSGFIANKNGNCGVAIGSAQVVYDVDFINNGNSCTLGVPDSLKLAANDVLLVATDSTVATLDVSQSLKEAGRSSELVLHHYYASTTGASSSGTGTGRTGQGPSSGFLGGVDISVLANLTPINLSALIAGNGTGSTSTTGVQPMSAGTGVTSSVIGTASITTGLPITTVPLETSNDTFMVITRQADGVVTGVWYGDAYSIGEGECLYYFSTGECGCIQGASSSDYIKIYSITEDYDGDGLADKDEKGGLGGPGSITCAEDYCQDPLYLGSECTSPILADTDGDLMTDKNEKDYGTHPLDTNSDDDGMMDGVEDSCVAEGASAGRYDMACETDALNPDTDVDGITDGDEVHSDGVYDISIDTDPTNADTDGDGMLDGDAAGTADPHPLCNDNESVCNYSDCRSQAFEVAIEADPSFSISTAEALASADDDLDGVPNMIEDSGTDVLLTYNCNYEASNSETNPLNPDSDADGCQDGEEDRNSNGVVDAGETNPRTSDTDGDGDIDGTEVAGCVYVAGNLEDSDPTLADTDGDGINDGVEDINNNGTVDAGETNPATADTDNDGLYDTAWPVAVVINADGTVSPAEEGRDLSPNYMDSTNSILNYYCGVSNYDYIDTDFDGETDGGESPNCRLDPSNIASANPLNPDTDGDGLVDGLEFCYGTSPWSMDTDGDAGFTATTSVEDMLSDPLNDYNEVSANGKISNEIMFGNCAGGVDFSQGALDPLYTNTSCSLNGNLLATSNGHYPITVVLAMFAGLLGLRSRKVVKA